MLVTIEIEVEIDVCVNRIAFFDIANASIINLNLIKVDLLIVNNLT
jgi:hypothetical protein